MWRTMATIFSALTVLLAQTTVNPDFSVIGDLIVEPDRLTSSGVELAIQGYVNPFARADVFLDKHLGDRAIELEEAFLSIERGLPLGLGLRAGKFRPDLGKINKEHAHTYPFIEAPAAVQAVLGEEMWGATGLEASALLPLPWYSNLSVGYLANGMAPNHHHNGEVADSDHEHLEEGTEPAFSTRFSHFFNLTSVTHLEVGVGYYHSMAEVWHDLAVVDFKFKWRPDRYRSFTWQGEYFRGSHEAAAAHTAYTWLNFHFNQIWNCGVVLDYASDMEEVSYASAGAFVGFSPVEESSVFRLRLHGAVHGAEISYTAMGQIIWSLGPHKPHRY